MHGEKLYNSILDMFNDIKNRDLSDFYHMNKYTIEYTKEGIVVKYTVPGADKDDLTIDIREDALHIEIKKNDQFSGLKDVFGVPSNVSIENIKATYKNGILTIILPYLQKPYNRKSVSIDVD